VPRIAVCVDADARRNPLQHPPQASVIESNTTPPPPPPPHQPRSLLVSGPSTWSQAPAAIDATFKFLVDAGACNLLVLSIAGIPVLDGVSGGPHA